MNNDLKCYRRYWVLLWCTRLYKVPCATQGSPLIFLKFLTLFFLVAEVLDPKINWLEIAQIFCFQFLPSLMKQTGAAD